MSADAKLSDMSMTNSCKLGDQCKKIQCYDNHPGRADCRSGNSCSRVICRYNHDLKHCLVGIKCTDPECKFRHRTKASTPSEPELRQNFTKHRKSGPYPKRNFEAPANLMSLQFWSANQDQSNSVAIKIEQNNPGSIVIGGLKTELPGLQDLDLEESGNSEPGSSQLKHETFQNRLKMNFAEVQAVKEHNAKIKSVCDQIEKVKFSTDYENVEDMKTKGTIVALEKHLAELTLQLQVFQEMRLRANRTLSGIELTHQLNRELYRFKNRLPALARRSEIEKYLENVTNRFLIIQGETGSGKSTQVAQYIADHPRFKGKKIICTQPRKLAAITLASRVSMEYSGGSRMAKPGQQIGFHVGGRKISGRKCRIEFVTEGTMLEKIMKGSPDTFSDVGCFVIDEAHERSIICDILLGSFKKEDTRWNEILIVVTSATIDLMEFSRYFNNAPTVEIEGRTFPVEICYNPVAENCNIRKEVVQCALRIHKTAKLTLGDILCFLPGQEDVLQAREAFEAEISRNNSPGLLQAKVFALYGRQEPDEQTKVFENMGANFRKVIFATDVAETSLTIDGVVYVVDSGVKKEMIFDPKRNISSLRVNGISRSSAIQRAGRSGRTQPGQCTRLYSEDDFVKMNISTAPEIFRKPLSLAILSLREMNFEPSDFDWISAPTKEAITAAEEELRFLKAVDTDNKATELGKLISESQQEPKLVKMIYRGCQEGHGLAAITVVSILTVSNIFFWHGSDADSKLQATKSRQGHAQSEGDIVTMYRLFEQWLSILHGTSQETKEVELDPQMETLNLGISCVKFDSDSISSDEEIVVTKTTVEIAQNLKVLEKCIAEYSKGKTKPEVSENQRRKNTKKETAEWCRQNYINGKAMGLALSTRDELRILFKGTNIWKQKPSQDNEPTNLELQRLVLSGYFLHSARVVHSKAGRGYQYFAIHPGVLGRLDYRAAIVSHKDAGKPDFAPPSWIIYDKILRLSSTIFPITCPIEESWIEEGSPEFYDLCITQSESLPTEKIIKQTSPECLRSIFGKYRVNLDSLESELGCCLDLDVESGVWAAYCTSKEKKSIEAAMDAKISFVTNTLKNQVIEEDYMSGTRVVIGQGYEVKEVLFPGEYTTICIRKLPLRDSKTSNNCSNNKSLNYVRAELSQCIITATEAGRRGMQENEIIRTIEITEHQVDRTAIIKFFSKSDAKVACERLKGNMMILGKSVDVIPTGLGPKRGVTQGEMSRLRISWSIGHSCHRANVSFTSPVEANTFINNIEFIFPGAKVSSVHGESTTSKSRNRSNKPLPPTTNLDATGQRMTGPCRFRFVVQDEPTLDFEYKVTIVSLKDDIDEYEIFSRVKPAIPKWIKVDRNVDTVDHNVYACEGFRLSEERAEKLRPLKDFMTVSTVTTDFFDKNLGRAGIYVHFDDKLTLQKAFRGADFSTLGESFGQQHRVEIEYTHATSVHPDLYKFLQDDFDQIRKLAWKKGVKPSEFIPKNNVGFVSLKFRSCNANVIKQVQEMLEEVSNCTKFVCEKMELLFTWTGRTYLTELAKKTFLHWDHRTYGIWIYGNNETQNKVTIELQRIADLLKSLEVFDKPLRLNKRKIDLMKNQKDVARMSRLCTVSELNHYRFSGNTIYASGSKVVVEKLEKSLEKDGSLFIKRPFKIAGSKGLPDCGICFCPAEGSFLLTSLCGHAFCMECIQAMFDVEPEQFPIICPECQVPLVISEISQCASRSKLRRFLEIAVKKFQQEHAEEIRFCPKPGCNQLLSYDARRSGEYGGEFIFCDECITTYCVSCSKKMEKPIKSHDYDSCNDAQNGPTDEVRVHVKKIQETIFNLSCPRCNVVFFQFIGCAAVICEFCKCGFCGICLLDCGNDSHPHVKECSKNPKRGEYFISEAALNQIHRKMRVDKLSEYFKQIEDTEVRNGVHRAIRRDLIDLRIQEIEIGLE